MKKKLVILVSVMLAALLLVGALALPTALAEASPGRRNWKRPPRSSV